MDIKKLQPDSLITVYHGTDYDTAYDFLQNGIDAKAEHYRKYPHWSGEGDRKVKVGLFISAELRVAKEFGKAVLEFEVKGKDLYPTNANTVEKIKLADSKVQRLYPDSFRPSVSFSLLSGGTESQALFRGLISPREIRKIYVYDLNSHKWNEISKEQYLTKYKPKEHYKKVVEPQEKVSLDEFYERVAKKEGCSVADLKKTVELEFDRRAKTDRERLDKFIYLFTIYAPLTVLKRLGRMAIQEFSMTKGFKAKVDAKYLVLSEVAMEQKDVYACIRSLYRCKEDLSGVNPV